MLLRFSDPVSFKLPILGAGFIIIVLLFLLSNEWIGEQETIIKRPQYITARIVEFSAPKVMPVPEKKAKPQKKITKKELKKTTKKKPSTSKTVNNISSQKKPLISPPVSTTPPLPSNDLSKALEKEEQYNQTIQTQQKDQKAKQAIKDAQQVTDYSSQINRLVQSVWRFPPSAKHDEEVALRVYLVPTGEVTEVVLLQSSGNGALDRSAEKAVWKVGRFPVPSDAVLFEKHFRQIILKLKPENARL